MARDAPTTLSARNDTKHDTEKESSPMETLVYLLPALACPVGMGLMMWLMMRGKGHQMDGAPAPTAHATPAPPAVQPADRLVELRAQLDQVQARQAAIAAEIGRLAAEPRAPAEQRAATAADAPAGGRA